MPCFSPIDGYRSTSGKITFARGPRSTGQLVSVSCKQCVGCRIDKSKEWAVRCVHEARMCEQASFVTLTYDKEHLPWDGSVSRQTHQVFIRALRDRIRPKEIRYYMCGEYGADQYEVIDGLRRFKIGPGRPHYHYLIFGYDFPDKYEWTQHRGHQYYRSPELEKVWTKGHSVIGPVTVETAAYTARYVLKKFTGEAAETRYQRCIIETGELIDIEPEFALMSLKPGIGQAWFEKYGCSDVYDSGDFVVIKGKKYKTPRYYDGLLEDLDERKLLDVKRARKMKALTRQDDNTWQRLEERRELLEMRTKKMRRGYEDE